MNKLVIVLATLVVAAVFGAVKAPAAFAYGQCGISTTNISAGVDAVAAKGNLGAVAAHMGFSSINGSLSWQLKHGLIHVKAAASVIATNRGCSRGRSFNAGSRRIGLGEDLTIRRPFWIDPSTVCEPYASGCKRITIGSINLPRNILPDSCWNTDTASLPVWAWVKEQKTATPTLPPKPSPKGWTVLAAKIAWRWKTTTSSWEMVKGVPAIIQQFVGKRAVKAWVIKSGGQWYKLTGKGSRPKSFCELTKVRDQYHPRNGQPCAKVRWSARDRVWEVIFVNETTKPNSSPPTPKPPTPAPPVVPPPATPVVPPPATPVVPKTPPNNPGGGGPGNPSQGNPQPPQAPATPTSQSAAPPGGTVDACQDPANTATCQAPPP